MIDLCYEIVTVLRQKGRKSYNIIYKVLKLIVNVLYPITICFHKECGINKAGDIIISLTSFPDRISTVYITIDTLLRQTLRSKKIVLWLAKEQFLNGMKGLPPNLLKMMERGLEIRFCDDLKSHKKYFYTMKEYADDIVITFDDDMFYGKRVVEELYKKHLEFPNAVVCNWGHEISYTEQGDLEEYLRWHGGVSDHTTPSYLLSPVGAEGILYPPHCIDDELFNKEVIIENVPYADDLWLKMMCVRKGTMAVRAKRTAIPYFNIVISQKVTLQQRNIIDHQNDMQLEAIFCRYPEIEIFLQSIRPISERN